MSNVDIPGPTRRGRTSISAAAARSREELERLEEVERRRKEEYKKEKELLARQLRHLDSQARRAEREQHVKDERRACYLLGALMLKAMRSQGVTDVQVNRADLNELAQADLCFVSTVVERRKDPTAPQVLPAATPGSESDPDDLPF